MVICKENVSLYYVILSYRLRLIKPIQLCPIRKFQLCDLVLYITWNFNLFVDETMNSFALTTEFLLYSLVPLNTDEDPYVSL